MAVELRVWHTDEGIDIPFFKVPYTRAALYAGMEGTPALSGTKNQLYQYDNFNSGSLLSFPYLEDCRWIARRAFAGYNPRNVLGTAPSGNFRFLLKSGTGNLMGSHSPGSALWQDGGTYEYLVHSGASIPPWCGIARSQIRPYPNELFGYIGATPQILSTVMVQTSDNLLVRLDFKVNSNMYGWQSWYVSRSGPSSLFPTNASTMVSTLIETSDDDGDDTMARFNPRTATSTVGCYIMNKDGLREFLRELWTTDFIESIRAAFIGDGSNALLGVRWFYGIKDDIPTSSQRGHVTLGNVGFTDIPDFPIAQKEFVEFDAGSVSVPQYYGDYRDWTLTTYQAYLPFIGIIDLAAQDVVGKTLYLKYWINLTDGSAVVNLSTTPTTPDGTGTIYSSTCSWGYDIPVRVDSVMDVASKIVNNSLAMVPIAGASLVNGAPSYTAGSLAPNSNVMGDFQPKVIAHRRSDLSGSGFAAAEGAPGAGTVRVGDATGFLKMTEVRNAGSLSMRRAGEIVALLKEGIYING